jgi:integrase
MASDEFTARTRARQSHKLSARTVTSVKPGRYGDGNGLWLAVSPKGTRKWVFRFTWKGRVTEAGLGSCPAVSLAEAREKAAKARKLLASDVNPIDARRAAKQAQNGAKTFGEVAETFVGAKSHEWRNAKHRAQWKMTLKTYCARISNRPIDKVDTAAVLDVLQPLWQSRPETASRLRSRIEAVLDAAKAQGHREGENPARWRGHLDKLLPKRQTLTRGHHAAMPYAEVPAFVASLRRRQAIAAMALEFLILTAARSGEVFGARWSEIDFDKRTWAVPAGRMKAAKDYRVPLSERALAILKALSTAKTGDLIFPGQHMSRPLSNMALTAVLKRMKIDRVTVHGFRSAFRDWAGDCTHFQRELAEAALAHVAGDQTERAYRRSDALERRRELMDAWARYLDQSEDNVLAFKKAAAASPQPSRG